MSVKQKLYNMLSALIEGDKQKTAQLFSEVTTIMSRNLLGEGCEDEEDMDMCPKCECDPCECKDTKKKKVVKEAACDDDCDDEDPDVRKVNADKKQREFETRNKKEISKAKKATKNADVETPEDDDK